MEQPGRSYLSRCRKSMSGRIRRRGSRHSRCRQDGHLSASSATKLHLTLHWTRGAPPFRDRRRPPFGLSLQSSSRSLQVGKCTA